eukprot:11195479-Alexandrium_andersonii.AAC.1
MAPRTNSASFGDVLSSWSGPKCRLIDIELAALKDGGLQPNVCIVPTAEEWWADQHFNCVEAVPECVLEAGSRRWPLGGFPNARRRAL